jgi:hypothetical protein
MLVQVRSWLHEFPSSRVLDRFGFSFCVSVGREIDLACENWFSAARGA